MDLACTLKRHGGKITRGGEGAGSSYLGRSVRPKVVNRTECKLRRVLLSSNSVSC